MDEKQILESLQKVLEKNESLLLASARKAGVEETEFCLYARGEILLVHASRVLQNFMRDKDPETYLLEMRRPTYPLDVRNEVILLQKGSAADIHKKLGIPIFYCLIALRAMGDDIEYKKGGYFKYVGNGNFMAMPAKWAMA